MDYKSSGVDIHAGDNVKTRIAEILGRTYTESVLTKGGEFAGVVKLDQSDVSIAVSIDGVGTKLKVAIMAQKHNTVGEDLVNHCINDIAVIGAEPLCFVDYISIGKLNDQVVLEIIDGLARGCKLNGIPLIGGETAQMPGLYQEGEYDLAGAIVGSVVEKDQLPRESMGIDDVLVGIQSNGLHTNGYSLVRRIVFEVKNWNIDTYNSDLGHTWGDELLRVHTSYLQLIRKYRSDSELKGFAHITGGGIPGNLSRILPDDLIAVIHRDSIPVEPVFPILQSVGKISQDEMFDVFNMGVGLIAVCSNKLAEEIISDSDIENHKWLLGEINTRSDTGGKVILT